MSEPTIQTTGAYSGMTYTVPLSVARTAFRMGPGDTKFSHPYGTITCIDGNNTDPISVTANKISVAESVGEIANRIRRANSEAYTNEFGADPTSAPAFTIKGGSGLNYTPPTVTLAPEPDVGAMVKALHDHAEASTSLAESLEALQEVKADCEEFAKALDVSAKAFQAILETR